MFVGVELDVAPSSCSFTNPTTPPAEQTITWLLVSAAVVLFFFAVPAISWPICRYKKMTLSECQQIVLGGITIFLLLAAKALTLSAYVYGTQQARELQEKKGEKTPAESGAAALRWVYFLFFVLEVLWACFELLSELIDWDVVKPCGTDRRQPRLDPDDLAPLLEHPSVNHDIHTRGKKEKANTASSAEDSLRGDLDRARTDLDEAKAIARNLRSQVEDEQKKRERIEREKNKLQDELQQITADLQHHVKEKEDLSREVKELREWQDSQRPDILMVAQIARLQQIGGGTA